jgi:predicted dinucleotide-binding enzyme
MNPQARHLNGTTKHDVTAPNVSEFNALKPEFRAAWIEEQLEIYSAVYAFHNQEANKLEARAKELRLGAGRAIIIHSAIEELA